MIFLIGIFGLIATISILGLSIKAIKKIAKKHVEINKSAVGEMLGDISVGTLKLKEDPIDIIEKEKKDFEDNFMDKLGLDKITINDEQYHIERKILPLHIQAENVLLGYKNKKIISALYNKVGKRIPLEYLKMHIGAIEINNGIEFLGEFVSNESISNRPVPKQCVANELQD